MGRSSHNAVGNTVSTDVTKEKIIVGHCSAMGYNRRVFITRFCEVNRLSLGRFEVKFNNSHPDGDTYEVLFGAEEGNTRDIPKISVERGSKTPNGFNFRITEDDNGLWADNYSAKGWSFEVLKTIEVVVNIK